MRQSQRIRILFVCGGNTCRSPMAAAITNARYGDVLVAESAGTAAWEPAANALAVEVLRDRFGIALSCHKPRDVDAIDIQRFDLVVAMDRFAAGDLDEVRGDTLEVREVRDPYVEGTRSAYEAAAEQILREIDKLAGRLRLASG